MNNDDIIKRLSEKAEIRKKTAAKIVATITDSIESELRQGKQITLTEIGKLISVKISTSVSKNTDGSYKVVPPFVYAEFNAYRETDQLSALKTAQKIISKIASEGVDAYKDAEVSYKQFCKIIRKSLSKGRKVKLSGLGTFSTNAEADNNYDMSVKFEVSQKFLKKLNENFENLREKVTFPIPPVSMLDSVKLPAREEQLSNKAVSDDNTFMKKKLALISQDLIRLNEEINNKAKKKDGGLWG